MSDYLLSERLIFTKHVSILKLFIILFSSLLLWATQTQSYAANSRGGQPLTEQESWVLEQVRQGREADLKKRFGGGNQKCRLRAGFLEKLLTGGFNTSGIPRQGVQISHALINGPLNLEYTEIENLLRLSHCIFQDPVKFYKTHFKKDLSFFGCQFLQSANFDGIRIEGKVFCDHALFERESVWRDGKINEEFHAEGTEFRSAAGKADFYGMNIGTNAFFTSARFHGPVDFELAHIGREFDANKAEFLNNQETASFNSMKVEENSFFKEAKFHGPVDFRIINIGGQFWADKAEFLNQEKPVNFSGIKVGNTIFFQKTKFQGPVKFEFAVIGVNFRGTGAEFLNACQAKNFSKMKVGHKVLLDEVTICCNVDLSYGDFYDLEIGGSPKDGQEGHKRSVDIAALNLKGTLVQRELIIANARIAELNVSYLQVKGPTRFNNVEIANWVDFRNSALQTLDFNHVKWPEKDNEKNTRKVYLGELTYNSISVDKQEGHIDYSQDDFQHIKDFVEASPFNTQSYVQLETFFKRIGREQWANEIFMRMHDRELTEKTAWWDPRRWLEWFFWGVLAGYGRAPFRVVLVSLVLITLGAFLYDPQYLTANKQPTEGQKYKSMVVRLFLSLDRFLPIELGLAKHWDSKGSNFIIWFWFHFQQFLGWILIPIALASIYTQIK